MVNENNEEKTINLSLIILSSLLLITLGGIGYLYFNLKAAEKKMPTFSKKTPIAKISPKEKALKTDQEKIEEKDLKLYENEKWEFSLTYPSIWGEASSEEVLGKTIIKLGPHSDFMVVIGIFKDPNTGQATSVEKLTNPETKDNCLRLETSIGDYQGLRLSCKKNKTPFEQFYLQKEEEVIYLLHYSYDPSQIDLEEATNTFNSVFNSFKLL